MTVDRCPGCGQTATAADLYPDRHHPGCVPTLDTLRQLWAVDPDNREWYAAMAEAGK